MSKGVVELLYLLFVVMMTMMLVSTLGLNVLGHYLPKGPIEVATIGLMLFVGWDRWMRHLEKKGLIR